MENTIGLERTRRLSVMDQSATKTFGEPNRYSLTIDFKQMPEDPEYANKYKQGSTNRMRGYWEVHGLPDYQMDEQGGPGLQGFTEVHSHRFKLYFRASLEKEPEAAEAVKDHELEHQLDPYASESEVRARTNTTSSNPHFSYRVLWSY